MFKRLTDFPFFFGDFLVGHNIGRSGWRSANGPSAGRLARLDSGLWAVLLETIEPEHFPSNVMTRNPFGTSAATSTNYGNECAKFNARER